MATHRRIVRSNSTSLESVPTQDSSLAIFLRSLHRIFSIFYRFLKIVWYWFERFFLIIFLIVLICWLAWWLSQKPSIYRDWDSVDAITPQITWSGNTARINNIRNHIWKSDIDFTPWYLDLSYSLDEIEWMQYIITPFSEYDGPAHAMISFSFSGWRHIVISPEIRKEKWESFDAVNGLLNQYELYYLVATEDDIIKLRTNYRNNQVYMYPIKTEKEKIQSIFRSMLVRTDKLIKEPEFYNTIWNNCATSVLSHANAFRIDKLDAWIQSLLPARSNELIYNAGLIDTNLSITEAREYYRIDEDARSVSGETIFSETIHKPIK